MSKRITKAQLAAENQALRAENAELKERIAALLAARGDGAGADPEAPAAPSPVLKPNEGGETAPVAFFEAASEPGDDGQSPGITSRTPDPARS